MGVTVVLPQMVQINPEFAAHRRAPVPGSERAPTFEMPTAQRPRARPGGEYPYTGDASPAVYAQGHPVGHGMARTDTSDINYGPAPVRVPTLFKDNISAWDGLSQHGMTQQNYRQQWPHFIPRPPTRGHRSVSGVLTGLGPTASRVRLPAVFVPSSSA